MNGTWEGAIDIAGATVDTSTSVTATATQLNVSAGTMSFGGGTTTVKELNFSDGTVTGAGTVAVSSSFDWTSASGSGTMSGSGTTVLQSGATGTINTCTEGFLRERTLRNESTLTMPSGDSELTMSEGARLENKGTFIANAQGECNRSESDISYEEVTGKPAPLFVNSGTFKLTEGTGATYVQVPFENTGTVEAVTGQFVFRGSGSSSESSHIKAASGASIAFTEDTYSPLNGTWEGVIDVAGATVDTSASVSAAAAQLNVSSGTVSFGGGTTTVKELNFSDGTVTGAGTVAVSSSFDWTAALGAGTMSGTGTTVLKHGATGTINTCSEAPLRERTLRNEGTLTMPSGDSELLLAEGATIDNDGTFVANAQGECNRSESDISFEEVAGKPNPVFINAGVFEKTEGTETTYVEVPFENLGTVDAITGHFYFRHPIAARETSTQWGGAENPSAPAEPHASCGDPVSCATGNYSETQTDFAIGGRGVGLDLTRTYNSQAAAEGVKGAFGYGWTSSFSDHLVVNKTSKVTTLHQANGSTVPFTEEGGGTFKAPVWTQDTLSGTEGAGYTLTLAGQVKYKFAGSSGRLESVTDRDGNATTLTYNEAGQLTTITDPVSRTIKLKYNGEGFVESAEDPMKHVVKYTYEGQTLKSVTQPAEESLRWQFKYDGSHRMTEMVDGRSGKTMNEYNGSNQVIKQEDPAGHKLKFEYEAFQTKITNENTGSVTDEYFTSNDEPSTITRGYGTASATTESFTYNEGGYVTSVTDGNGHTTTYGYSAANDRTSMVDPNKNETKWEYDSTHDVISMTTPKGETTTIKREAHGNPETIERPAPESKTQVTKYKYAATGELESVENPLKNLWKYEYDAKGDRTAEIDALATGNKRTWEYNEDSQVVAEVSPRGNIAGGKPESFETKTERNAKGLPTK